MDDNESTKKLPFSNLSWTYNELFKNYFQGLNEQLSEINESISRAISSIQPIIEFSKKLSENLSEIFGPIQDLLDNLAPRYITKEQYEVYISNACQYGRSGWGIHPDFSDYVVTMDPGESKLIIDDCIKNIDSSIDSCFKAIEDEIESDYKHVIDEASICYNNKCYRACCSLLISQIDRIFQSFCYSQYKMKRIYRGEVREKLSKKIAEDYDVCIHDISRMLLWRSLEETLNIIYREFELEHYSKDYDNDILNRHCIQHGYSLHTFINEDCLQLSMLLYTVICVTKDWKIIYSRSFGMIGTIVKEDDMESVSKSTVDQ